MKCESLQLITPLFYFILDTQQKQSSGSSTESQKNLEKSGRGAQASAIVSIVILIGVLLAVLTCWLWRRRSSRLVSYTGNEAFHLLKNSFSFAKIFNVTQHAARRYA